MTGWELAHYGSLVFMIVYMLVIGGFEPRILRALYAGTTFFCYVVFWVWESSLPALWLMGGHTFMGILQVLFGSARVSFIIALLFVFLSMIDLLFVLFSLPPHWLPHAAGAGWFVYVGLNCKVSHDRSDYRPLFSIRSFFGFILSGGLFCLQNSKMEAQKQTATEQDKRRA